MQAELVASRWGPIEDIISSDASTPDERNLDAPITLDDRVALHNCWIRKSTLLRHARQSDPLTAGNALPRVRHRGHPVWEAILYWVSIGIYYVFSRSRSMIAKSIE